MDAVLLCDSLGLMVDSERQAGAAWVHMEAWSDALGLREMQVGGEGGQGEGGSEGFWLRDSLPA